MNAPGTSAWRAEKWGKGCDESVIIKAHWIAGAGPIQCHRNSIRVWRAVGRIIRKHGYVIRSDVTGCYNCRKITGGTSLSAHAQGVALDTNWDTNPYRTDKPVTDMSSAMIREIQQLKNDTGAIAVRWGGDWDGRPETKNSNYDTMHWEIMCTQLDVKIGFSIPAFPEDDRHLWPLLAMDEKGGAVMQLQLYLSQEQKIEQDGYFGRMTEQAVKVYQASRSLPTDGIVGLGTWTALITKQPRVQLIGMSPHKGQAQ